MAAAAASTTNSMVVMPLAHVQARSRAVRLLAAECPDANARRVEQEVFAWAMSATAYEDKITQLAAALRLNYANLRAHTEHALVGLSDEDLAVGTPIATYAALQKERERKQTALLQEEVSSSSGGSREFLMCGKCKNTSISIEQKQTRGADEGMTVFCLCTKCGHKWRM